jgi:mannosylglycoprotein endo-beta-mannosidase
MTPIQLDSATTNWSALNDSASAGLTGVALTNSIVEQGQQYTSAGFTPTSWIAATVPSTILNTVLRDPHWLKKNLITKLTVQPEFYDPYFDENLLNIPDVSKPGGIDLYTYWYYTEVKLAPGSADERNWLNLRGMNYAADVFVNGHRLGGEQLLGMFLRHNLDFTKYASEDGITRIAVRVAPPNPPGALIATGNGGGSPNIANNVTMRYPVGWDWVPSIPDRCTGIWDQVSVSKTKGLVLRHPKVITTVLDTSKKHLLAAPTVDIKVDVLNASNEVQYGEISYTMETYTETKKLKFPPGTTPVQFTVFAVDNARLWWPHGTDRANLNKPAALYDLTITATVHADGGTAQLSDTESLRIGIREVSDTQHPVTTKNGPAKSRQFKVNGTQVFIRGGNWMGTDALFRFGTQRYHDEVRMHRDMNLNLIRVWGGGLIERPEFYEACDELGVLVMQEFWFSGEKMPIVDATYQTTFTNCAKDTIQMLRNHASLLFWCAANESTPPTELLAELHTYIGPGTTAPKSLDDTRILVDNSFAISGVEGGDGPYGVLHVDRYFDWLPGNDHGPNYWQNPFNPEIGSLGFPAVESMRQMMSIDALEPIPKRNAVPQEVGGAVPRPLVNSTMQLHRYSQEVVDYPDKANPVDQVYTYGAPTNIEEFSDRAQLASYLHYKILWEGYLTHMWDWYTGMIIWKSQNPFAGLRAQLYDWYLEQTGGYWGVKHACEPIHVHLNMTGYPKSTDFEVMVVNQTAESLTNLNLDWTVYGLKSILGAGTVPILPTSGVTIPHHVSSACNLPLQAVLANLESTVYFVLLTLKNETETLSTNFYWLSLTGGFEDLGTYSVKGPTATATGSKAAADYSLTVHLENTTDQLSFWNRLQVRIPNATAETDARVLPVFYDDNYCSIPGKTTKQITATFQADIDGGQQPELWLKSWNNEQWTEITVEWS